MKKLLIGLAIVVVVLLAGLLIAPGFVDWNTYKSQISAAARDATGRELTIDGDISLSLLPAPALSVEGVRLGNAPGVEPADMVRLKELDVRVRLMPLLSGRIEVASVRLVEPVAYLIVQPDGAANWHFQPPAGDGEAAGAPGAPEAGGETFALTLDRFEVTDGRIVYRDLAGGAEEVVEEVNLEGSAGSLAGPFAINGSLRARGMPLAVSIDTGAMEPGGPVPLRANIELREAGASLRLSGAVQQPEVAPRFVGEVTVDAKSVGAVARQFGAEVPPPFAGPAQLDAKVSASATEAALNDVRLSIADTLASGAINLGFADNVNFDVALSVGRLDLDRMLATAGEGKAGGEKAADKPDEGAGEAADGFQVPAIPANLTGNLNINIDGMAWRGSVIRQIQLALAIADGEVELNRAAALLPGGSDVGLSGRAVNRDGKPRFDGRFEMASDNLRGLLGWLDVDVGRVPGDRLASLSVTADLSLMPELLQVAGANLRLDNISAGGAGAIRLQARPSFGLSLDVDRVNLDGYLPAGPAAADAAGEKQATEAGTKDGEAAAPLAALDDFDANLVVNVGQLISNGVTMKGIATDLSLVRGKLTIRRAGIADLAGAKLSVSGSAAEFAGNPSFDLAANMTAPDLSGLSRLFRLDLGVPPERLTAVALNAKATGTASDLAVDATLEAAGGVAGISGQLRNVLETPSFDLAFDIKHSSLAALSRTLDLGIVPLKGADEPVAVAGSVKGDMKAVELQLDGQVAAGRAQLSGILAGLDKEPAFDLKADLTGEDLVRSVRALGSDYQPALRQMGGYSLNAGVKGDTKNIQISGLRGRAGPVSLEGQASARLDGPRPYVNASLATSEIIVDMFLPASAPATGGVGGKTAGPAAGRERWSRERIDLSALNALDADLDLSAPGLVYGPYPFGQPRLKLKLADGVLTIADLSGKLFKGNVGLQATLNSTPRPALGLGVRVDGADIKEALTATAGIDNVSGTLGFEGSFQAAGASEWDLVRSLAGNARVTAGDGAIQGFDMKSFSAQLGELDGTTAFLSLANRAFAGGQTALHSATGNWEVQNGIARTDDTQATLDASRATVTGLVDLPEWQMDLMASLVLTEHPKAPPMGVHLTGPLDAPRRDIKTEEMERYIATRVGSEALRKTIGKDKEGVGKVLDALTGQGSSQSSQPQQQQQPAPQQPTQQQPAEEKPSLEKALPGLLQNLLKNK